MKARRRILTMAIASASVMALVGCALVIDLGDESKLRPSEAGVDSSVVDTGIVDSGAPLDAPTDTGPLQPDLPACGLAHSPNRACAECIAPACCEVNKTCFADPACAAGLECIKDCMVQFGCIINCVADQNANLNAVTQCSQGSCPICTPGPNCTKLGECGVLFADSGAELIIRSQVRSLILELDEAKCLTQQRTMHNYNDAGECQPVP